MENTDSLQESESKSGAVARAFQRGILAVEIAPFTNGPLRYGLFALTLASTKNVPLSATVLATSTLALEGGAGVAMAHVIERKDSRIVEKVSKFLGKFMKDDTQISPIVEFGVANYLGTPALLLAKQQVDPSRTLEINRRHGMFTGAWLAGSCAVQGVLIGEGVTDPTNPRVVAPVLGALGLMSYGYRRVKKQFMRNSDEV